MREGKGTVVGGRIGEEKVKMKGDKVKTLREVQGRSKGKMEKVRKDGRSARTLVNGVCALEPGSVLSLFVFRLFLGCAFPGTRQDGGQGTSQRAGTSLRAARRSRSRMLGWSTVRAEAGLGPLFACVSRFARQQPWSLGGQLVTTVAGTLCEK